MTAVVLATQNDLPSCLDVRRDAFAASAHRSYTPEQVATLLDDIRPEELSAMVENASLFVVRGRDRDVIALAGWKGEELRHVYVSPRHSGTGLGTALLSAVESDFWLRNPKAGLIRTGVVLYAENFYKKNGYVTVERATDWDGSEFFKMKKPRP